MVVDELEGDVPEQGHTDEVEAQGEMKKWMDSPRKRESAFIQSVLEVVLDGASYWRVDY